MACRMAAREHQGTAKCTCADGSLLVLCPVALGMEAVQKSDHSKQAGLCFLVAAAAVWPPPWNTSVLK